MKGDSTPARPLWRGVIAFDLVTVPVAVYPGLTRHVLPARPQPASTKASGTRVLEVTSFVSETDIPIVAVDNAHLVGPGFRQSVHAYALLAHGMEQKQCVGVASWLYRNRRRSVLLRARYGSLVMLSLAERREIRSAGEMALFGEVQQANLDLTDRECEMAAQLIERHRSDWDPELEDASLLLRPNAL